MGFGRGIQCVGIGHTGSSIPRAPCMYASQSAQSNPTNRLVHHTCTHAHPFQIQPNQPNQTASSYTTGKPFRGPSAVGFGLTGFIAGYLLAAQSSWGRLTGPFRVVV